MLPLDTPATRTVARRKRNPYRTIRLAVKYFGMTVKYTAILSVVLLVIASWMNVGIWFAPVGEEFALWDMISTWVMWISAGTLIAAFVMDPDLVIDPIVAGVRRVRKAIRDFRDWFLTQEREWGTIEDDHKAVADDWQAVNDDWNTVEEDMNAGSIAAAAAAAQHARMIVHERYRNRYEYRPRRENALTQALSTIGSFFMTIGVMLFLTVIIFMVAA